MFNNECLGHLEYEAIAPAIAMASLMIIFTIDFLAARWLARRSALHGHKEPESPSTVDEKNHFAHDHDFSGIDEGVLAGRDTARARWEVKLLEAGICFHSIMIGVTLGAQGGAGFVGFSVICGLGLADLLNLSRSPPSVRSSSTSSLKGWV
jgi:zinc transporter 1/2/3